MKKNKDTRYFMWKNPKREKTSGVHKLQNRSLLGEEYNKFTNLSSSSSSDDYRVTHSFTLSLSLVIEATTFTV